MVVFPFVDEPTGLIWKNIECARVHPRVRQVVAVGREFNQTFIQLEQQCQNLGISSTVKVTLQQRLGTLRVGKGDAINTGFNHFLDSGLERLHLYDADIRNFGPDWIDAAETQGEKCGGSVRHIYPRSSTDGMITAFITRPGFAIGFPQTAWLSQFQQPLGGEMMLERKMVESLWSQPLIRQQSDWGIDTLVTFFQLQSGYPISEVLIPTGKMHQLYGTLADLKTMLVECMAAIQTLTSLAPPSVQPQVWADTESSAFTSNDVSPEISQTCAYDVSGTETEASSPLSAAATDLYQRLGLPAAQRWVKGRSSGHIDAGMWFRILKVALSEFRLGDVGWEELMFRWWSLRVLTYTHQQTKEGYRSAVRYLDRTVTDYRRWSLPTTQIS